MQQAGPEDVMGQFCKVLPVHSSGQACADEAANAGARHHLRTNTCFAQRFDHTDVRYSSNGTAAQSQPYAARLKFMQQPGHPGQLYSVKPESPAAARIREIAGIADTLRAPRPYLAASRRGRLTRTIDAVITWVRHHLPALHWLGAAAFAAALFLYWRIAGFTIRLVTAGAIAWPDLPAPCVLALWHGSAPAFLCAIARKRPKAQMAIMVSHDPRGDSLALLCRLMGMRVVRGDSLHGGWEAVIEMSEVVEAGGCAVITPDGGGPAKFAKPGAAVLAAATGAPIITVGANCSPALAEPKKWDAPRNPLPFSRVAIAVAEPFQVPAEHDAESLEACRRLLQQKLEDAGAEADRRLVSTGPAASRG